MGARSAGQAVAYVRVSTDRQDVTNQRREILELANEKGLGRVRFVEEVISGRRPWRERDLGRVMAELQAGDSLVVAELSRLGRSMLEIMEILALAVRQEVRVFAAKGNWALNGDLQSKIVATVLAMAAEIERDLISQRTRAALATKKAQGVKLGRPKGPGKSKLDPRRDEILELLALGLPKVRLAVRLGTTVANLNHWLKRRGLGS